MRTCFFFAAILFSFITSAQFPYNPLPFKQADFKKIKDLGYTRLFIYRLNDGSKELATEIEYGNNGLIAAMYDKGVNDNGDSINTSETYYKFDGKGRLLQSENKDEDYGESITVFTYGSSGKLVMKKTATIDPPTYKYKYDAKGRLSEVNVTQTLPVYNDDGDWEGKTFERPSSRYTYKYNAKGQLSEEWEYTMHTGEKPSDPSYKTLWTYNEKNLVIQIRRINESGEEINNEKYEYNRDGIISKVIFNDGGPNVVYLYEYCKGCKQSWMK